MTTRTITLSAEHWQRINDALLDCCDEGPPGESCKSPGLLSAVAALDAALAQPEPQGASDEEIAADFRCWYNERYYHSYFGGIALVECIEWTRYALARYTRPAIEPVPVAERLPGPGDCDESGLTCNGCGWCWWFEQSSQMWVADYYSSHYAYWLPYYALPMPQQQEVE